MSTKPTRRWRYSKKRLRALEDERRALDAYLDAIGTDWRTSPLRDPEAHDASWRDTFALRDALQDEIAHSYRALRQRSKGQPARGAR